MGGQVFWTSWPDVEDALEDADHLGVLEEGGIDFAGCRGAGMEEARRQTDGEAVRGHPVRCRLAYDALQVVQQKQQDLLAAAKQKPETIFYCFGDLRQIEQSTFPVSSLRTSRTTIPFVSSRCNQDSFVTILNMLSGSFLFKTR